MKGSDMETLPIFTFMQNAPMKLLYTILVLFIAINTTAAKTTISVSSVKDFFQALDDNTEIIIQCDTLNFTLENLEKELKIKETADHWGSNQAPTSRALKSYYLSSGIVLYGYENLIIRSEVNTAIISDNSYDNILSFKHCKDIKLEGVSIFHTPPTCNGSVLSVLQSNKVTVNNCALNGSGGIGALLIGTKDVQFNHIDIFNNVFYAVYAINSNEISFTNCNIYDNLDWGESVFYSDLSQLSFQNCEIWNNEASNLIYSSMGILPYASFNDCNIKENAFSFDLQEYLADSEGNNDQLSKERKRNDILQLFMVFLKQELNSGHDNRNEEFLSFFNRKYKIEYKSQSVFSNFLTLYYGLKHKEFLIDEFLILADNEVMINEGKENQEVWKFCFNKKNELKKIEVK